MRRLFMIAAQNLSPDDLRVEIQKMIDSKKAGASSSSHTTPKYRETRDMYFKNQKIPESAQDWILKFLRDNKIRGWFEDTLP